VSNNPIGMVNPDIGDVVLTNKTIDRGGSVG